MKYNLHLLAIITLICLAFLSCKKDILNEPVSLGNNSLSFADSSANNLNNAKYQALLDKYIKKGIPGLVILIKTPQDGLWIGSAGYARIEDKTPMSKLSILYSASVAKTYTAVAIMLLVEEGKIALDDKMNKYLPKDMCDKLPNGNKATVRQLLNHTSGIPNNDWSTIMIAKILNDPFSIAPEDNITCEYGVSPAFEPGKQVLYSSTGYELLARIIDHITGESHGKYFTSHIFEPLSLENTYYKNEAEYPHPKGLVNGYFDRLGNGKIENVSDIWNYTVKIYAGGDGLMASIYDYYLFLDGLVKGKLVNSDSYKEMNTWVKSNYNDSYYGLGLYKAATKYGYKIGKSGTGMGCGMDIYYFPEKDTYILSGTNLGTFIDSDLSLIYSNDFKNELLDLVFKN